MEASAKKAPKKTTPTRVDTEIFGEAQAAGAIHSRSAAQQIDLWVRIGKELESSPAISQRDIQRVLAGDGSYDELSEREQAVVRAAWEEDVEERIAALDYEERFTAEGRAWTDVDAEGHPIRRVPGRPAS